MSQIYKVNKTTDGWEFANEGVLENFIWDNLENLMKLKPLRRQHHVDGNYCDILAMGDNRQLIVIELKNTEDRYVIQQLTRYYDALLKEKPFQDSIDSKKTIELKVISPILHKDNLIDRKYHKLKFDLLEFSIIGDSQPRFQLKKLDRSSICEFEIPYEMEPKDNQTREIPAPPKSLNTALARCSNHDPKIMLMLRENILKYDERIQEITVKSGHFIFGKGETKPCAELTIKQYYENRPHDPLFSLWLPISFSGSKYRFGKVTLPETLFRLDGASRLNHGYLCYMAGETRQKVKERWSINEYIWYFLRKELNKEIEHWNNLSEPIKEYCEQKNLPNPEESNIKCLEFFVEIALEKWRERL